MALSIQQSEEYMGNGRWRWSVWLNGSAKELDAVDHVDYLLHPAYHKAVWPVKDRATQFRLDTTGLGTFTLVANVVDRNGRQTRLQHDLILLYPDGTPTIA